VAANGGTEMPGDIMLAASPGVVHGSLFGAFALTEPGGTPITLANRRARALLAMLCLEPGQPMAREQITRLLWSGRFEAQAKASLRQCLLELGKALEPLGVPFLDVTRERIGLIASLVCSDLGDLESALASGKVEEAIQTLRSIGATPLLDDLNFGDSFAEWLTVRRDQIALRLQASVNQALADLKTRGDKTWRRSC
jgi:DNA-binding SARP family transcriptional activator